MYERMDESGEVVALIKPQFEAGREKVGKKGVVRDPAVHKEVIRKVVSFAEETGFVPSALDFSPVKGPEGNIEYLFYFQKTGEREAAEQSAALQWEDRIREVVTASHQSLDGSREG